MRVEIKPGSTPIACSQRRYPPDARKFMERYANRILEYGFGEVTTEAKWIAAPVITEKPPPALYRFTMDYKNVNAVTEPISWPMPHIDAELVDVLGTKAFALIDFVSGFWQLPLERQSQNLLAFQTMDRIIKPTRTTQGAKNSAPNFQSKVEPLFGNIKKNLKAWIDDL